MYVGCVRDKPDRVLKNLYKNDNMTPEVRIFFRLQLR